MEKLHSKVTCTYFCIEHVLDVPYELVTLQENTCAVSCKKMSKKVSECHKIQLGKGNSVYGS